MQAAEDGLGGGLLVVALIVVRQPIVEGSSLIMQDTDRTKECLAGLAE